MTDKLRRLIRRIPEELDGMVADCGGDVGAALGRLLFAPPPLTGRQVQVLELARDGLTEKEIADRIGIGRNSAHVHIAKAKRKLDAATVDEVATCYRRGILARDGDRP
jgi:DNA-binding CsgD family transcriptional regulator